MKVHDVREDHTGTGLPRLTCHTCDAATLVRQPWMSDTRWKAERVQFMILHPNRTALIAKAQYFWDGFYKCPNTGRILEAMEGDDKVLCPCRKSNPEVPSERTEQTGVHIRRYLTPALVEDYIDQQDRDASK